MVGNEETKGWCMSNDMAKQESTLEPIEHLNIECFNVKYFTGFQTQNTGF